MSFLVSFHVSNDMRALCKKIVTKESTIASISNTLSLIQEAISKNEVSKVQTEKFGDSVVSSIQTLGSQTVTKQSYSYQQTQALILNQKNGKYLLYPFHALQHVFI